MIEPELTDLATAIGGKLTDRGERIAVAESSAGGLISASLLSVPGASAYYQGGIVIYNVASTRNLLSSDVELPNDVQGASEPFARYLAQAVAATLGSPWAVSETGAAGPTGNRYGNPAGHAWVAVAGPGGTVDAAVVSTGSDDRAANMVAFARAALELLHKKLFADGRK